MSSPMDARPLPPTHVPSDDRRRARLRDGAALALLAVAWPLLLGNLLNSLTGTGISLWYGQLMGDRAIAVVSFFQPIMFFLVSLAMGISSGATVVAGRAHGARDHETLGRLAKTTLLVGGGLGVAIAVLGVLFLGPIMDGTGAPASVRAQLERYAVGMFAFVPLLFVFLSLSALLRGVGQAGFASKLVAIVSVLTLAIAPLCVLLGGGYEGYGVAAYAAASVIAHLAMFVHLHGRARKGRVPLDVRIGSLASASFDGRLLREILKIGLPASLQMNLTALSHVAMMAMIAGDGDAAVAGFGAANQVLGYAQYPLYSLGIAASILCAQAIGAGDRARMRRIAGVAIAIAAGAGALVACATVASAKPLLGLFLHGREASGIAVQYLGFGAIALLFSGVVAVLAGLLRAEGDTLWPSIVGLASIWLVQIPAARVLHAEHGLIGLWWSFPIGAGVGLIATALYYAFRRRRAAAAIRRRAPESPGSPGDSRTTE